MKIGVLSDTHGVIHPGVFEHFRGVDHLLHAGDLGDPDVLDALREIAPVVAVRGNVDDFPGASRIPDSVDVTLGGLPIHMTHIGRSEAEWAVALDRRAAAGAPRPRLVVCGHTHAPKRVEVGGYVFLNPGSAGQRRFHLPLAIAILEIADAPNGGAPPFEIRPIVLVEGS